MNRIQESMDYWRMQRNPEVRDVVDPCWIDYDNILSVETLLEGIPHRDVTIPHVRVLFRNGHIQYYDLMGSLGKQIYRWLQVKIEEEALNVQETSG